jgi:type I restriction enzyme S subunit
LKKRIWRPKGKIKNDKGAFRLRVYADELAAAADLSLDTYPPRKIRVPIRRRSPSGELPNVSRTQAFQATDVLVSNINPYFRCIWLADRNGGCSDDILAPLAKWNRNPEFTCLSLSCGCFFEYPAAAAKETKIPSGGKRAVMLCEVRDLPIETRIRIAGVFAT